MSRGLRGISPVITSTKSIHEIGPFKQSMARLCHPLSWDDTKLFTVPWGCIVCSRLGYISVDLEIREMGNFWFGPDRPGLWENGFSGRVPLVNSLKLFMT